MPSAGDVAGALALKMNNKNLDRVLCACNSKKCEGICCEEHLRNDFKLNKDSICIAAYWPETNVAKHRTRG